MSSLDWIMKEASQFDGEPDRPTQLEAGTEAAPRSRTEIDRGSGTVLEDGADAIYDGPLTDESFSGFVPEKRLSATSGEAEILLACHPETKEKRVVKLYYNRRHPQIDILEKLSKSEAKYVPRLYGWGYGRSGRFYELQEYIEGGSLHNLISAGIRDEKFAQAIVSEIASALAYLNAEGIVLRDLKPENILVRRLDPLDLVLVDFGIARTTDGKLRKTRIEETTLYSPPEGGEIIHPKRDWWSVGIIVVQMRAGKHPWEGFPDYKINTLKRTQPSPIPDRMGDRWIRLAKGLLTRDLDTRWGEAEVARWLKGDNDIPINYEKAVLDPIGSNGFTDYERKITFYSPADLVRTLADPDCDGEKNEAFICRNGDQLAGWLRSIDKDPMAEPLLKIIQDDALIPPAKVAAAIWLLDESRDADPENNGAIWLRGTRLSENDAPMLCAKPDAFRLSPKEVQEIIKSETLGKWQRQLTSRTWWDTVIAQRTRALAFAAKHGLEGQLRMEQAIPRSMAAAKSVIGEARKLAESLAYSPNPALNGILTRPANMSFEEAWLLLSVEPELLLSPGGNTVRILHQRLESLRPLINVLEARLIARTCILNSGLAMAVFCAIGVIASFGPPHFASATLSRNYWISIVLWWLIIVPCVCAVLLAVYRRIQRGLIIDNSTAGEVPATMADWDKLVAYHRAKVASILGHQLNNRTDAWKAWNELAEQENQILSSNPGLDSPKLRFPSNPGRARRALVGFQLILFASLLLSPFIHDRASSRIEQAWRKRSHAINMACYGMTGMPQIIASYNAARAAYLDIVGKNQGNLDKYGGAKWGEAKRLAAMASTAGTTQERTDHYREAVDLARKIVAENEEFFRLRNEYLARRDAVAESDLLKYAPETYRKIKALDSTLLDANDTVTAKAQHEEVSKLIAVAVDEISGRRMEEEQMLKARAESQVMRAMVAKTLPKEDFPEMMAAAVQLVEQGDSVGARADQFVEAESKYNEATRLFTRIVGGYQAALALRRQYNDQADIFKDDIPDLEKYVGDEWAKVKAQIATAQSSKTIFEAAPHYRAAHQQLVEAVRHMDQKRRKEMGKP